MLVELLRSSRLALLYGQAGSDKTSLLKEGLMPLLHRRSSDQVAPARTSGVVVPFPDRRNRTSGRTSKRRRELVVYFDDWSDTPLLALHARIHLAAGSSTAERAAPPLHLADTLNVLSNRLDATFIILLDRFEEFLEAPPQREDISRFERELVEAIHQVRLPANFLISLNEEFRPRLSGLRGCIPGFDDFSLKLPGAMATTPPHALPPNPVPPEALVIENLPVLTDSVILPTQIEGASAPAKNGARRAKLKVPRPPQLPIKREDVYAFIEATLAQTVPEVVSDPFVAGEPVVQPALGECASGAHSADTPPPTARVSPSRPDMTLGEEPASADLVSHASAVSRPSRNKPPMTLKHAVKWVGERLHPKPKPRR